MPLLALLLVAAPALADPGDASQTDAPGKVATTQGDTQHRAPTGAGRADGDISPSALTADTRKTPPPGLIGDWHKVRTALAKKGIGVTARYASESVYNVAGGDKHQLDETGQFDAGVLLDLDKVAGLKGGAFQGTITWRRGRDLGADANLGVLQQVQEVYGRGQTVRVTQLWYEQRLGRQVEMKVGRTNPGEDFAAFSCHFENLSFCGAQPGNLVDYWYNFPVSQWGAGVRARHGQVYLQAAVYETNPRNLEKGLSIGHFHGATGVLVPVELGWTPSLGVAKLPGSYKVGGWYETADADDVLRDRLGGIRTVTGLPARQRNGRYGAYITIEQQISGTVVEGKAATGLAVFLNATYADRATSMIDSQVSLGIFYRGFFAAFPNDAIGLGAARTHVNRRSSKSDFYAEPLSERARSENAVELYYSAHPVRGVELRPNLQWVRHPGGLHDRANVGIVGLKAALTL